MSPIAEQIDQGIQPLSGTTDPILCTLRPVIDPVFAPALDPLFNCPTGQNAAGLVTVVDRVHTGNLVGSYSITDWLEVGADIPFSYMESRAQGVDEGLAIENIRLLGKVQLLDPLSKGIGVAAIPFVEVPSGDEDHLVSNGTTNYGLIAVTEAVGDRVRGALNVGYKVNDKPFDKKDETDEILFGLGLGFLVIGHQPILPADSDRVELLGEVFGATAEQYPFQDEFVTPVEFLGGFRWYSHYGFLAAAGAGRRITESINGPDFRVVAELGYTWQPVPPPPAPPAAEAPPPPPQAKVIVTDEQIITLEPIYFDFDKATIKPVSYPVLDQVAQAMVERPNLKVRVEGHTDAIGTEAYNQKLSEQRAYAVVEYLGRKGVDPSRLQAAGFGKGRPIAPNETTEGRAKNRRTEFHILNGTNGTG